MLNAAKPVPDPLDRLKFSGPAYVAFALRRPEHFTVMFDVPISRRQHPKLATAADRAFGTLVTFVKACQNERQMPAGETLEYALAAWSLVHGIARLAVTRRLPYRTRADMLKFAAFAIDRSLPNEPKS